MSHQAAATALDVMQYIEFQEEEFLKLEPELCPLQGLLITGQMDVMESLGQRHEVETVDQFGRKRVGNVLHRRCIKQTDNEFVNRTRGERAVAQHLGEVIHASETLGLVLDSERVHLGMDDV